MRNMAINFIDQVCVPAMVYVIQNNLFYIAASHLEAATFMVGAVYSIYPSHISQSDLLSTQNFHYCSVLYVHTGKISVRLAIASSSFFLNHIWAGIFQKNKLQSGASEKL